MKVGAMNIGQEEDRSGRSNYAWASIDLDRAIGARAPAPVIESLNDDRNRAERVEKLSAAFLSPSDILIELNIAERRGAAPDVVRMYRDKFNIAMARVSPAPPPPPLPGLPPAGIPAGTASDSPLDQRRGGLGDLPVTLALTSPFWVTVLWLLYRRQTAARRRT